MKSILALCGSTRAQSSNLQLIHILARQLESVYFTQIFSQLSQIPAFNPDEEHLAPDSVLSFRDALRSADLVLISSPEYAAGVPGVLKNALDWCVGSSEFYAKRCALITASTRGTDAHASLQATLRIMGAELPDQNCLLLSGIRSKIDATGALVDPLAREALNKLVEHLM